MTNKEIEAKLKELATEIDNLKNRKLTIRDLSLGEDFIYNGHTYTLIATGVGLLKDYDETYTECCFDNVDNDYKMSLIRHYINSEKFLKWLSIDKNDIILQDGDFCKLLSKEEYKQVKPLLNVDEYLYCWWLRSAGSLDCDACGVDDVGYVGDDYGVFDGSSGVRPALHFNLKSLISRAERT